MHDFPGLSFLRRNIPQLLQSDSVVLGAAACIEFEALQKLLAQVSAATFGKERVFGTKFVARLVGWFFIARTAHAHVACGNAVDAVVVVKQDLRCGETRENVNAECLGLFTEPST